MLRRAASSAYSWWWASRIRTNQSKWLDGNLQEMDDRVKSMIRIIEEDADSFSKKAEMYFRKRPELIKIVEETYRAYRALAERYDHVSGELHKANHTIATAFPDQLQFEMQDEDDDHLPKAITTINLGGLNRLSVDDSQEVLLSNINEKTSSSMVDREKAPGEIDRIQKEILVLQTEKEFIRISYENAVARFEQIETQISALQEELFLLQNSFPDGVIINDDEARILMASTALRSCEDALLGMQEKQKRSAELTRMGSRRIMMAKEKLKSFKADPGVSQVIIYEEATVKEVLEPNEKPVEIRPDMSVVELAEKINELVNKVISLELTTSSQSAQIESLRMETDELHQHVESLEEEKVTLIVDSSSLSNRLKQTEDELLKVQDNQKLVPAANAASLPRSNDLGFDDDCNSKKLQTPKPEEWSNRELDIRNGPVSEERKEIHGEMEVASQVTREELGTRFLEQDNSMDSLQSLFNGQVDKENILLMYTSILESYGQIKKKLLDVEKRNQDYICATNAQLMELKKANDVKDEEIWSMQKLLELNKKPIENELQVSNVEKNSSPLDPEVSENVSDEAAVEVDEVSDTTNTLKDTSPLVEKFRKDIDTLLDENLEFWLRFSTSFQQIQKFHAEFDDLQAAFKRLNDKKTEEGSDKAPIEKQLRELKAELQAWLEQSEFLEGELKGRFSSLCYVQEEIAGALVASLESGNTHLSTYQAANFQGEVCNMQHENNKVADELQVGVDNARRLRTEVKKILSEFHEKYEPSSSQANQHHARPSKHFPSKIPLRNFLFGVKPKKKPSIFKCVNPAYQKQYSDLSSFPS